MLASVLKNILMDKAVSLAWFQSDFSFFYFETYNRDFAYHFSSSCQFPRLKTFDDRVPLNGGPALINPFNLEIVSEKVDDKQYKSTVEFFKDICQIRHNAEVVSTGKQKRN